MAEAAKTCPSGTCEDWVGNPWMLGTIWGLPGVAMLVGVFLDPITRGVIWTSALVWMGVACLANSRRCGRTHCRFTGPFFFVMAAFVAAYAVGVLPIGAYGWAILAVVTTIGNAGLWWASEHILGKFSRSA